MAVQQVFCGVLLLGFIENNNYHSCVVPIYIYIYVCVCVCVCACVCVRAHKCVDMIQFIYTYERRKTYICTDVHTHALSLSLSLSLSHTHTHTHKLLSLKQSLTYRFFRFAVLYCTHLNKTQNGTPRLILKKDITESDITLETIPDHRLSISIASNREKKRKHPVTMQCFWNLLFLFIYSFIFRDANREKESERDRDWGREFEVLLCKG